MSFTDKLKNWTEIIKNIVIVAGIALAVIFAALSIVANVTENNEGKLPDPPSIEKAQYRFFLTDTWEYLYTDSYDIEGSGSYLLHGYYALSDGKYRLQKIELPLNEKYCGDIVIIDRAAVGDK